VNVCRALSAGSLSAALGSAAWIVFMALVLAPFPFRLMRKRIIV